MMFLIEKRYSNPNSYWIVDRKERPQRYLHSDGSILVTAEYWPTPEAAQAVLDKYQPKHEWKSGDVFVYRGKQNGYRSSRVVLFGAGATRSVHYIDTPHTKAFGPVDHYLGNAEFLFNISERI